VCAGEGRRAEIKLDVKDAGGHLHRSGVRACAVKGERRAGLRSAGRGVVEGELQVVSAARWRAPIAQAPLISESRALREGRTRKYQQDGNEPDQLADLQTSVHGFSPLSDHQKGWPSRAACVAVTAVGSAASSSQHSCVAL